LIESFIEACSIGHLEGLAQLMAADAVLYSDGGAKVAAALAPIHRADHVARFFISGMIESCLATQCEQTMVQQEVKFCEGPLG
jgi:hypothetical protein